VVNQFLIFYFHLYSPPPPQQCAVGIVVYALT
jgi:hypothetical protein